MEAARLGLGDLPGGCGVRGGGGGGPSLALPVDPWLAPPLLSALPGFLAHPHTGYPSYLTPPDPTPRPADPRSSSIAALRLKAKEHIETISKGLQLVHPHAALESPLAAAEAAAAAAAAARRAHLAEPAEGMAGAGPRTPSWNRPTLEKGHVESFSKELQMV